MNHRLQTNLQRRLAMTFRMQQALAILQMPQIELSEFIQEEIDKNPLLEEVKKTKSHFIDCEVPSTHSVYENLTLQIRDNFSEKHDLLIAKRFLENLDEKGFLSIPLHTIAEENVLAIMQTFEPPGIFARNLQESFLLQLKAQGRENTDIYTLVQDHFNDLLHGRYALLKKKCESIDLADAIQKLAMLRMRPLDCFKNEISNPIVVDLTIRMTETGWIVGTNDEDLPKFHLHTRYDSIIPNSAAEQDTIRIWRSQGKWLLNALSRRREMLLQIGTCLIRHQNQYLEQKGEIAPLTNQELALQLSVHESTISRAIAGKYVETPRGIIPLKSLLIAKPETKQAKDILQELIDQENKKIPLTDDDLAMELKKRGYLVARRTVSKYRKELKIQSANTRKLFN